MYDEGLGPTPTTLFSYQKYGKKKSKLEVVQLVLKWVEGFGIRVKWETKFLAIIVRIVE